MLINQEGVIISVTGESPGGIFAVTTHVWTRCSCHFHILFTSRTLKNSHREALCIWKVFAHGKIKSGRTSLGKKKKKNRLKEGRKGTPNEGLNVITVLNVIKS